MSTALCFDIEASLWDQLVCDRELSHRICFKLLRLRGHEELADRVLQEDPDAAVVAWAEGLVALRDLRTLPLLLELIDDTLETTRSWQAVDVALDGIVVFGRTIAVSTLARLMGHHEVELRFRAAAKLASLEAAELPLRWLALGRSEDARVAAAWGLVTIGHPDTALQYLRSHGAVLIPRIVGLGPRGVRILCGCPVRLLGDRFDAAAALLAKKRQHFRLLLDLTANGSELARVALELMDAPRRPRDTLPVVTARSQPVHLYAPPARPGRFPTLDPLWNPPEVTHEAQHQTVDVHAGDYPRRGAARSAATTGDASRLPGSQAFDLSSASFA